MRTTLKNAVLRAVGFSLVTWSASCSENIAQGEADSDDDHDVVLRTTVEPDFTDVTKWTFVGTAQVSTTAPATFPVTPDVPVAPGANDPVDSPSVVALHKAVVIRDSDDAMFEKVNASPNAPMDRSTGIPASINLAGTSGIREAEDAESVEDGSWRQLCDAAGVACTVFPSDGRTRRSGTTSYPWRTMVGLYLKNSEGPTFCSGVFIGPRHVLTAAHCVWNPSTNKLTKVHVVPGVNGFGNEPFGKESVKFYVLPKGWDEEDSIRYDYALLVLHDTELTLGWQGFAAKSHTSLNESTGWLAGYPASHHTCTNSPHASSVCWDYLYAQSCTLEQVWASEIWHKCDAQTGNSGGPHYHYNGGNRQVVGVVAAQSSNWNKDSRIRSGSFDSLCDWIGDYSSDHSHDCY